MIQSNFNFRKLHGIKLPIGLCLDVGQRAFNMIQWPFGWPYIALHCLALQYVALPKTFYPF